MSGKYVFKKPKPIVIEEAALKHRKKPYKRSTQQSKQVNSLKFPELKTSHLSLALFNSNDKILQEEVSVNEEGLCDGETCLVSCFILSF